MIKLIAVNQTGEDVFECPQSWDETPTQTFQRIATEWDWENFLKLISIVSGIEFDYIRESTDGKLEVKLIAAVQYIVNPKKVTEWDKLPIPKSIEYKGRTIELPKKTVITIGQSIAIRQAMQVYALRFKDNLTIRSFVKDFFFDGLVAYAASVYLQPIITSQSFDSDLAKDVEDELLKMPITQIYPIGFFLLMKLQRTGKDLNSVSMTWMDSVKHGLAKILGSMTTKKVKSWLRLQSLKGSIRIAI
jgi:hypothetical protein